MSESCRLRQKNRHEERGAARLKFIITLAVIVLIGYMGYQYIPVAYHAYTFRKEMDEVVEKAAAANVSTGDKSQWAADQLKTSGKKDYGVPDNAQYKPSLLGNGQVSVQVKFTQPVNLLPGFTYQYNFDYTAKSSTFLNP